MKRSEKIVKRIKKVKEPEVEKPKNISPVVPAAIPKQPIKPEIKIYETKGKGEKIVRKTVKKRPPKRIKKRPEVPASGRSRGKSPAVSAKGSKSRRYILGIPWWRI